ncbi:MAG: fructan hydrolase [Muribaculaceae bacterium]|nr:fructan hydrolase [Muribaculaceae bacterium]
MAFVATDKDGSEWIYERKPFRKFRDDDAWSPSGLERECLELPSGSIRKLIGRELTWEDEPVELKGEW